MGPLKGLRFIELAGIGPGPLAGQILADLGADVISIDRNAEPAAAPVPPDVNRRGKRSIALDLKAPEGVEAILKLCETADALFEGFRPGVAERLGIGPAACMARNPKLVYGRMTGWGQTGPLAQVAGHDLNYIAITGALHAMGSPDRPPAPPLNLVGDYGGGTMFLLVGMLAAIIEAKSSGKGQVIDAAMTEGASILTSLVHTLMGFGVWSEARGANMLDGGAHYYGCYETKDAKYVSVGAIEPQFYALLKEKAGLDDATFEPQNDKAQWPDLTAKLAVLFKTKTRDEWCAIMEGTDICFAPVLSWSEAPEHPHAKARGSFVTIDGQIQPAPAPRFSRTEAKVARGAFKAGGDTKAVLADAGFSEAEIARMIETGVAKTPA